MESCATLNPSIELAAGLGQLKMLILANGKSELAKIEKDQKLTDLMKKMLHGMGNIRVNERKRKDADTEECIQYGSKQLLLCKRREQEASQRRGTEHRGRKGRARTRSKDWLEINPLLHQHKRTGEKLHQQSKGWKMQRCNCGVHPGNYVKGVPLTWRG